MANREKGRRRGGRQGGERRTGGRGQRISNSSEAGLSGQDAFQDGDDEISLEPGFAEGTSKHIRNTRNGLNDTRDGLDLDEDEVLALNLDSQSDYPIPADTSNDDIPSKKEKPRRKHDKTKELIPLTSQTSRYDKPAPKAKKAKPQEDQDISSDGDVQGEEAAGHVEKQQNDNDNAASLSSDDDASDSFDDEWARTGGYHVSKREIARLEAKVAKEGTGRIGRNDQADQTDQLELYEALKIQRDTKLDLDEGDYGFGEDDDDTLHAKAHEAQHAMNGSGNLIHKSSIPNFATRDEAIAHLVATEPELLALLDDLSASAERLALIRTHITSMLVQHAEDSPPVAFAYLYLELMTSYVTTLAFFLHVRAKRQSKAASTMSATVLVQLAKLRSAISKMEDLDLFHLPGEEARMDLYHGRGNDDSEDDEDDEVDDDDDEGGNILSSTDRLNLMRQLGELEEDELEDLMAEREALLEHEAQYDGRLKSNATASLNKRKHPNGNEQDDHEEHSPALISKTKKRRLSRNQRKQSSENAASMAKDRLLNLEPITTSQRPGAQDAASLFGAGSDLLDPSFLSSTDAADKAQRKKSLRFYTSKIEAKAASRAGATRDRQGGDDDIPYRSKERARAAALRRQQHANPASSDTADLDDAAFGEADLSTSKDLADDAQADGYYELVSRGKKAAAAARKGEYEESVLNDRAAYVSNAPLDASGPRAVNRQIMANKGLTPKRPKSVRNPRVKKRIRYEKAQQKSASMKPTYKGGLGNASYQGEKSGISSRVVKSRAL